MIFSIFVWFDGSNVHFSVRSRWMGYCCLLLLLIQSINLICLIYDGRRGIYEFISLSSSWVLVVCCHDGYSLGLRKDEEIQNPWDYEVLFSKCILLWYLFTHLVVAYVNTPQMSKVFLLDNIFNSSLDFSFFIWETVVLPPSLSLFWEKSVI